MNFADVVRSGARVGVGHNLAAGLSLSVSSCTTANATRRSRHSRSGRLISTHTIVPGGIEDAEVSKARRAVARRSRTWRVEVGGKSSFQTSFHDVRINHSRFVLAPKLLSSTPR